MKLRSRLPDPDHTVAEVLANWPQAIRVFLDHNMACVGCAMSSFDTVAEAVANYGGVLDSFLAELAQAACEPGGSP